MERDARHRRRRGALTLSATGACICLGCGYGFGNHKYREMQHTAASFAQALTVNDTLRMRQLSWGLVHDNVVAIHRDLPHAYMQFARPTPQLVALEGGGLYQGDVSASFLVTSPALVSCDGGVRLDLLMVDKNPRVVSVRLQPPIDSVTDDACRAAIGRS